LQPSNFQLLNHLKCSFSNNTSSLVIETLHNLHNQFNNQPKTPTMKKKISSSLILLSLACFLLPLSMLAQGVKGDGNVTKESRKVSDFHAVKVSSGIDLYLTQGNTVSLEIEADKNLHEHIATEVKDGVLKIYVKKSIRQAKEMNAYLTFKEIDALVASGGSDVENSGTMNLKKLKIDCSGGSDAQLNLKVDELKCVTSGGSDSYLSGEARIFYAKSSGGSDLHAMELKATECEIESSGGSDARVYATEKLTIESSGGSDVYYKGDALVNAHSSGGSDIHKKQ
jgi:hypothetical protein